MKKSLVLTAAVLFLLGITLVDAAPAADGEKGRSATVRVFTDDFGVTVGDPGRWNRGDRDGRHFRNPERHGPFRDYRGDHRWRRGGGLWIDAWFGPPRYGRWNRPYPPSYSWRDRPYRDREYDRHRQYETRIWVAGRMTEGGYVPGYWKIVPLGGGRPDE